VGAILMSWTLAAVAFLGDWKPPGPLIGSIVGFSLIPSFACGMLMFLGSIGLIGICDRQMQSCAHWRAAEEHGLWYTRAAPGELLSWLQQFESMRGRPSPRVHDVIFGRCDGLDVIVLQHDSDREEDGRSAKYLIFVGGSPHDLPRFQIAPRSTSFKAQGTASITGTAAADRFSAAYTVTGHDTLRIEQALEGIHDRDWSSDGDWYVEAAGCDLALFRSSFARVVRSIFRPPRQNFMDQAQNDVRELIAGGRTMVEVLGMTMSTRSS